MPESLGFSGTPGTPDLAGVVDSPPRAGGAAPGTSDKKERIRWGAAARYSSRRADLPLSVGQEVDTGVVRVLGHGDDSGPILRPARAGSIGRARSGGAYRVMAVIVGVVPPAEGGPHLMREIGAGV